ncbi:ABC transporter ATP-binding protein [Rhodococcus coprophilus]|uniref:ABC transporter ATP-binding protein n=1 Tax=Rhodococcus coprophilus TaxID=38310 RepID=A0A2X4WZJ1_9NOCA|nr:ABC transporter ATP-binding protein [Rhodococcus coprophilus]MBM7458389.1 putative ABC transport system ATP-binding protein [Rhodococcus coprophilus]SQI32455.1 ABC transporter ATP-binding protein [Rhodococcus coprophilus]
MSATTTTTGLSLKNVGLQFGDGDSTVTALDDVNLEVAPGELVAIVGPSGAGKSSLLAVAGGLTQPTSGSVVLRDIDLTATPQRQLAEIRRNQIGFVFQSSNLLPSLTALDQLRLMSTITGRPGRDPNELLESVGMAHRAGKRPGQLSGGERQRVGIARALVTDPAVLLVDEPTAALDRARSHEVVQLLADETHRAGVATIMVTHDHDVLVHCDRVLEMIDGKLSPLATDAA